MTRVSFAGLGGRSKNPLTSDQPIQAVATPQSVVVTLPSFVVPPVSQAIQLAALEDQNQAISERIRQQATAGHPQPRTFSVPPKKDPVAEAVLRRARQILSGS